MAEREARQRVAGVHEHRIAQRKLLREQDLAREVVAGEQLRDERRTLAHGVGAICRGARGEEAGRAPGVLGFDGERHGEAGRHEAQPRIEADVLHRARHRLEPDHPASGAAQPRDPRVDGRLAVPRTLTVFADGERAQDRKSTRLNSSHGSISYAVFCLKKKNTAYYQRKCKRWLWNSDNPGIVQIRSFIPYTTNFQRTLLNYGCFFFFNDTPTPEMYILSLLDALPI